PADRSAPPGDRPAPADRRDAPAARRDAPAARRPAPVSHRPVLSPVGAGTAAGISGSPDPDRVLLAFCGHSGSGKTTLMTRLIPRPRERGWQGAGVKHGPRVGLDRAANERQ